MSRHLTVEQAQAVVLAAGIGTVMIPIMLVLLRIRNGRER